MSQGPRVDRHLRRQLLLLELESNRMDLAAGIAQLRNPLQSLRLGTGLAASMGGKVGLAAALAALVAGPRLTWLLRLAPLALAGWRIARLLRARRASRSHAATDEA